jgi:ABC-2 type transport system ATP-binding protein
VLKNTLVERAKDGAAVIISSHLLAMVEDLCTHVLILSKGESQFCGPLADLKAAYMTEDQQGTLERIFFIATERSAQRCETA